MNRQNLRFYSFISHGVRPKTYKGKIMLVAFIGTHVPLLALIIYIVISHLFSLEIAIRLVAIALLATLIGTAATIILDLDNLKDINSTLGRQVGDLLLRKVAQRLTTQMQKTDLLSRFGGDKFGILRRNINSSNNLNALVQKLLNTLAEPFFLYGKEIYTSARIGITISPFDGTSVEQLLQNVDAAIHQVKQQGNTFLFYSTEMNARLQRRLAIKEKLSGAIKRGEMFLHYQPRIDLKNRIPVSV